VAFLFEGILQMQSAESKFLKIIIATIAKYKLLRISQREKPLRLRSCPHERKK
jgi:hypothetical protein